MAEFGVDLRTVVLLAHLGEIKACLCSAADSANTARYWAAEKPAANTP